jgi:acetyltransferase EpsM
MKNPAVIIIGTSLEARAVADMLLLTDQIVYGYMYLEESGTDETEFNNVPVLGSLADKEYLKVLQNIQTDYVVVEANLKMREPLLNRLFDLTKKLPINVVHPSVMIPESSELTSGNILPAGCLIGSEVKVQALNLFGLGVIIENGVQIGSFNTIQPGVILNRNVIIENEVFIGAGAIIYPDVTIETGAVIGAGAVVMKDVEEYATVYGNPAQVVQKSHP